MRTKTGMTGTALVAVLFMIGGRAAADSVSLDTAARNEQTGAARVVVCLDSKKPLVCFSVVLRATARHANMASTSTVLNNARLPSHGRSVNTEADGTRLVFDVADLAGEETMVTAGTGWVFALDFPLGVDPSAASIKIEQAKAFDCSGNEVRIDFAQAD